MNESNRENWMSMRSVPDGSMLLFAVDGEGNEGKTDPLRFELLDRDLWDCQSDNQMTCTFKCRGKIYAKLMMLISERERLRGTVRIELPDLGWFSQWRVAVLNVEDAHMYDADHMTGNLTFTVTNTAPDGRSEMGPVFGNLASR